MKEKDILNDAWKEAKKARRRENLSMLTGRYKGTYYEEGVPNPRKPKKLPKGIKLPKI